MQQQRLKLQIPPRPDYGRWVRHSGVEQAASRLALWLVQGGTLWLTSDEQAGKSHFVEALQEDHPHIGLIRATAQPLPSFKQTQQWVESLSQAAYWIVDTEPGSFTRAQATAVFHLIERAREMNRPLLIVWRDSGECNLPPEFMSRLRMLEQVKMQAPLADVDLLAVLRSIADGMQWQVKESILNLLIKELPRDLKSQVYALEKLESGSLKLPHQLTQEWARQHLMEHQAGR